MGDSKRKPHKSRSDKICTPEFLDNLKKTVDKPDTLMSKVNKEVYLDVLRDVVVPWMKSVAGKSKFTFQQESAPAHKAKVVQKWLGRSVPHFWS